MRKVICSLIIIAISFPKIYSQHFGNLYIPATINSPLFKKDTINETQVGAKINNYGINTNFSIEWNRNIIITSVQFNSGNIHFDPLNFNDYQDQEDARQWIQSQPSSTLYLEFGYGYNFKLAQKRLSLIAGVGTDQINDNTRYFLQLDWAGRETKYINAGFSLRANYSHVNDSALIVLEPAVQAKIKVWKIRIVNQFEYSIGVYQENQTKLYMKPTFTIGLEYVF